MVMCVHFQESSHVPSPPMYTHEDGTQVTNFPDSLALWANVDKRIEWRFGNCTNGAAPVTTNPRLVKNISKYKPKLPMNDIERAFEKAIWKADLPPSHNMHNRSSANEKFALEWAVPR